MEVEVGAGVLQLEEARIGEAFPHLTDGEQHAGNFAKVLNKVEWK